jgi:hypothetical protein
MKGTLEVLENATPLLAAAAAVWKLRLFGPGHSECRQQRQAMWAMHMPNLAIG